MPNYLSPGVYVKEIFSNSRPIESAATSTTAFVGATQRNNTSKPVLIHSFDDYTNAFGHATSTNDVMALSVLAFYNNGGDAAYICPVSTTTTDASVAHDDTLIPPGAAVYTRFYSKVLRKIREVSIIVLPGQSWPENGTGNAIISATITHCEEMKNRVLIIDPAESTMLRNAADVTRMALPTSSYTALYYPWLIVTNPLYHSEKNPTVNKTVNIGPSAIAAGIWAKIGSQHDVWKAPAGVNTQLTGVLSSRYQVGNTSQNLLNPLGINCIRDYSRYGLLLWGSRTLATNTNSEWRYIPVRRTEIYIRASIYDSIQWAAFEPNTEPLWRALRDEIATFMNELFRAGAFQGAKTDEAYFVHCGMGITMTQRDIDQGRVIIDIGFSPLKPAEFVTIRIQQKVARKTLQKAKTLFRYRRRFGL